MDTLTAGLIEEVRQLRQRVSELEGREEDRRDSSGVPVYPTLAATGVVVVTADQALGASTGLVYSGGNLGIGTGSPGVALDIASTSSAALFARIRSSVADSNNGIAIGNDAQVWSLQVRGANSDAFQVLNEAGGGAPITVLPSNFVGINNATPEAALDVAGLVVVRGSQGGFYALPRDGSGEHWNLYNPDGTNFRVWNTNSGDVASITPGGYLYVGGSTTASYRIELPNHASASGQGRANAWVTYSAGMWKKRVRVPDKTELRAKLKRLRTVEYDNAPEVGDGSSIGLIAEEVREVFPELVTGDPERPETLGLMYDRLGAVLLPEVQTLIADNEALKQTVQQQQAAIEQLTRAVEALQRRPPQP